MNSQVSREFDALMALAHGRCRNAQEMSMVRKSFEFADKAHKGVLQHSGKPYILRSIEIAKIVVSKVGLGYKSICAALLLDVIETADYTADDLRSLFGSKIASLVEGVSNMNKILAADPALDASLEDVQAENLKLILLSMGGDVRVVLIKLAECLQCMRTLDEYPEVRRSKMLADSMNIFIPLAHRLGLYSIKSELENIWLRYEHPQEYKEIAERTDKDLAGKAMELDKFIEPIAEALLEKGFKFTVKKRIKTPYSIWYKMKNKNVPFEQIYDLYAVRIIFDPETDDIGTERDKAFVIYSTVSSMYKGKDSRFRDWIRHPKKNGYEALHLTVMSDSGMWVEVQIRSRRMDDIAEKGIAAHWAYKNDGYLSESDNDVDRWLARVQDILASDNIDALELLDLVHDNLATSEIVVFTPRGHQRSIAKGATALDFAYKVHTSIGNHAIAAKINTKLSPLSEKLKAGDQIEIITAGSAQPKTEWLSFLHTRGAKRRVMEWLRDNAPERLAEAESILNGAAVSERSTAAFKLELSGKLRPEIIEDIKNALKQIDGIEDVKISSL